MSNQPKELSPTNDEILNTVILSCVMQGAIAHRNMDHKALPNIDECVLSRIQDKIRSLINDLIYAPWDPIKMGKLKRLLRSMAIDTSISDNREQTIHDIAGKLERLAKTRNYGDLLSALGDHMGAYTLLQHVNKRHTIILDFVMAAFTV